MAKRGRDLYLPIVSYTISRGGAEQGDDSTARFRVDKVGGEEEQKKKATYFWYL